MIITVNNLTIESTDQANAIRAAIESFGPEPNLETVRAWALELLNTWRGEARTRFGLTESMYYEALRWQADPASRLGLNPGRLSNEAYTHQVISRWNKVEADYNLAVSLVNQAKDIDTIEIILSRRG